MSLEQEIGIVTFYSSHHALQAENVLQKMGLEVKLIPGPKEISPNCGVALQFHYPERKKIEDILENKNVKYEAIHIYKSSQKKTLLDKFLDR